MLKTKTKMMSLVALTLASGLALAGCSSGNSMNNEPNALTNNTPSTSETTEPLDMVGNLVGPGCADYAEAVPEGSGSVEGMAQDPVATAASNNPLLTTLTSAVSGELNPEVSFVDTLNGGEFTVLCQ